MCVKSSLITKRLSDSKKRAKKNNWVHDLDHDYISHLLKQSGERCPLTGEKFVYRSHHPLNISIDRIDNKRGYTKDNVWVVSTWANKAKSNLTQDQFVEFCEKIIKEAA